MDLENSKPDAISPSAAATSPTTPGEEAQRSFAKHKDAYEKLRADIAVKMQFLDENRVRYEFELSFINNLIFWFGLD